MTSFSWPLARETKTFPPAPSGALRRSLTSAPAGPTYSAAAPLPPQTPRPRQPSSLKRVLLDFTDDWTGLSGARATQLGKIDGLLVIAPVFADNAALLIGRQQLCPLISRTTVPRSADFANLATSRGADFVKKLHGSRLWQVRYVTCCRPTEVASKARNLRIFSLSNRPTVHSGRTWPPRGLDRLKRRSWPPGCLDPHADLWRSTPISDGTETHETAKYVAYVERPSL